MADKNQMRLLREQGLTHKKIAEIVGVSRQYVANICGKCDPAYFVPVTEKCIYPNIRDWMNNNKISRKEFLRRMGYVASTRNYDNLNHYLWGKTHPRKPYIDKMLKVTGMDYETMFYTEVNNG